MRDLPHVCALWAPMHALHGSPMFSSVAFFHFESFDFKSFTFASLGFISFNFISFGLSSIFLFPGAIVAKIGDRGGETLSEFSSDVSPDFIR